MRDINISVTPIFSSMPLSKPLQELQTLFKTPGALFFSLFPKRSQLSYCHWATLNKRKILFLHWGVIRTGCELNVLENFPSIPPGWQAKHLCRVEWRVETFFWGQSHNPVALEHCTCFILRQDLSLCVRVHMLCVVLYMSLYTNVCMSAHWCVCVCICRSEHNTGCFSLVTFCLILSEKGLMLDLEFMDLPGLMASKFQESACLHFSSTEITDLILYAQVCRWVLEIWSQVLMLVGQTLPWLNYISCPRQALSM